MPELLLELYSEEVPPQLQIAARSQIKQLVENSLKEDNVKYKELSVYSSPTRLTLHSFASNRVWRTNESVAVLQIRRTDKTEGCSKTYGILSFCFSIFLLSNS